MKKGLVSLVLLLLFSANINSQVTTITDPLFEQELVLQHIDSDQTVNGHVLTQDLALVTTFSIDVNYVNNLDGLEAFVNLENLEIFGVTYIYSINLSQNTHLKKFKLYNSNITNINFNNNVLLENIFIANNTITNINIDNCTAMNSLILLDCPITYINLVNNLALKVLFFHKIGLLTIDISQNINLEELYLYQLGTPFTIFPYFSVDSNIKLKKLAIALVYFETINLSNNLLLEELDLGANGLLEIDVSANVLLNRLKVDNNHLTTIDVSNLPLLNNFSCPNNNIANLFFNNNPLLEILICNNSGVQNLRIQNGNNSLLNGVITLNGVDYNRFSAIGNPNLKCIYIDDIANCNANWLGKDSTTNFVTTLSECNLLNNNQFNKNSISIYPNPFQEFVFLENFNKSKITDVSIYDVNGQKVFNEKQNFQKLDLSNLSDGFYLIKIITDSETFYRKIIKN